MLCCCCCYFHTGDKPHSWKSLHNSGPLPCCCRTHQNSSTEHMLFPFACQSMPQTAPEKQAQLACCSVPLCTHTAKPTLSCAASLRSNTNANPFHNHKHKQGRRVQLLQNAAAAVVLQDRQQSLNQTPQLERSATNIQPNQSCNKEGISNGMGAC
jgi:hypothetical protein